jgi:hypothetical protein
LGTYDVLNGEQIVRRLYHEVGDLDVFTVISDVHAVNEIEIRILEAFYNWFW